DSSKPCSSFLSIGSLGFSRSGFCFTSGLPPRFSVAGWAILFSLLCEWITAWRWAWFSGCLRLCSLYRPKADMCGALAHVCFGPIADIIPQVHFAQARKTVWLFRGSASLLVVGLGSNMTAPHCCFNCFRWVPSEWLQLSTEVIDAETTRCRGDGARRNFISTCFRASPFDDGTCFLKPTKPSRLDRCSGCNRQG